MAPSPVPLKNILDRETTEMRKRKQIERNPIAKDLRTPKYHKRVVRSKKVYNRKTLVRASQVDESGSFSGNSGGLEW